MSRVRNERPPADEDPRKPGQRRAARSGKTDGGGLTARVRARLRLQQLRAKLEQPDGIVLDSPNPGTA